MPKRWAWIAAGLAMCARGSPQGDLSNTIPTALRGFSCVVPHSDVVTPLGRMMYPSGGGGGEPPPSVDGVIPPEFGWLVGEITLQECVDLCASWETVRTRIDSTRPFDRPHLGSCQPLGLAPWPREGDGQTVWVGLCEGIPSSLASTVRRRHRPLSCSFLLCEMRFLIILGGRGSCTIMCCGDDQPGVWSPSTQNLATSEGVARGGVHVSEENHVAWLAHARVVASSRCSNQLFVGNTLAF